MRARLLLFALAAALVGAPGANAAPPVLQHGVFAGSQPPAPPFEPASPIKSFKIEILPF
jgi:hypothetical protein